VGRPEGQPPRECLIDRPIVSRKPKPDAPYPAVRQELADHPRRRVDRNGEAQALGHRDDRRVDPDHATR